MALVDFEHLVPQDHVLEKGSVLFRKEFYDTGLCIDAEGREQSLKAFARDWVVVAESGETSDEDGIDDGEVGASVFCVAPSIGMDQGHSEQQL